MLSSEERRLIAGILALLLFGGIVKMCRNQSTEQDTAKTTLPSAPATAPSGATRSE
jgi:hypothetical protein